MAISNGAGLDGIGYKPCSGAIGLAKTVRVTARVTANITTEMKRV